MDKQSLELLLAQGESIERIAKRFGKDPSTVSYWCDKYGLSSPHAEMYAAKGALDKEQLEQLVEAGMTIAEIANEVRRSKTTVRHWLKRYGLTTKNTRGPRSAVTQAAKEEGHVTIKMTCAHHGDTEFFLEQRGYYRCRRCRSEAVARRRRKVKGILVAEAGGRCAICGYDEHPAALEFHHLDPTQKRMTVSASGISYGLETLRREARKCVLLCSNCHALVEHGVRAVPDTVVAQMARSERLAPESGGLIHHNPG